ncbi:TPA: hypothetical protein OME37_002297 [Klebsiella michiganensis]|uniref:Uncharacterized protein n=1 Tax=Klebsiella pasteurii TaxID=2587529 RepID=A0A9Q9SAU8_9ENTR|nr:hypothetical protein [Klebsiella pasteurii]SBL15842.1 Uncharacterised protein [Klebsiella michiganensis]HCD5407655.1 hypothetical protein [Klebsiella oxytoca]VUS83740.1 hypothetical protein SB6410_03642 [Klebsiella pasteurii]VUT18913.1 hypothetical protein SB6409_04205 [Klebsiella pasteurii]HCE9040863.1 hypothetical protein [Klebsiella michiganensis]
MESSTTFKIFYDAEDDELAQHKIDAKTLSLSIGSMAELISKADKNLNDGQETVKLMVTTPAAEGSIGVVYSMMELVPNAINVAKVIGLTAAGGAFIGAPALSLIRQLGSKRVISITKRPQTHEAVLELEDGEIVCNDAVAKLVTDPEIRQALVNVVRAPLDGKTNPVFKILDQEGNEVLRLENEETEEVKPLPRGTLLEKEVSIDEVNVRFVQVNFEGNKGWRIDYLGDEHSVSLDDNVFLSQVQAATVQFSKEDLYVVDLETIKTYTARGVTHRYTIKKVKRKRPA